MELSSCHTQKGPAPKHRHALRGQNLHSFPGGREGICRLSKLTVLPVKEYGNCPRFDAGLPTGPSAYAPPSPTSAP
jgi:hypothetical protein